MGAVDLTRLKRLAIALLATVLANVLTNLSATLLLVPLVAPLGEDPLRREAARLGAHLARAQEEAVLATRSVEVVVDDDGYRFAVRRLGGWTALDGASFRPIAWRDDVAPLLRREGERIAFRFDPVGVAEPAVVTLVRGTQRAQVEVDGAGRIRIDGQEG